MIAPDFNATPERRRWFALDDPAMRKSLEGSPRLVTWVVRTADLRQALAQVPGAEGDLVSVTRGTLSWRISVPTDGSLPSGGAFPTLIEWPKGAHPSSGMADLGCRLERVSVELPDGTALAARLAPFLDDRRVSIARGNEIQLCAMIMTPDGPRELS